MTLYADPACIRPQHPLEQHMMKRIRTAIEAKRVAEQTQSFYAWRPGPGRD